MMQMNKLGWRGNLKEEAHSEDLG